jgi:hypothetical protein
MSGLTVKQCFDMFPTMTGKDMSKIIGRDNLNDTDVISAQAIAQYNGQFAQPLSIFYAKNDTNEFIPLLQGQKQQSIMKQAGIRPEDVRSLDLAQQNNNQIDKDTSIFDVAKKDSNNLT